MPATASRRDFLKGLAGLWAVLGAAAGTALTGVKRAVSRSRRPALRRLDPPRFSVKRDA